MKQWPPWRVGQVAALSQYVLPDEVGARLPGVPPRADPDVRRRLRTLYEAFVAAEVTYDLEPPATDGQWQHIRPPDQVLSFPGHATCLDAAIVFVGACLAAGLHPLLVVAEPATTSAAAHAVVVVWLHGSWSGRPDADYPQPELDLDAVRRELRTSVDESGAFVALDPSTALLRRGSTPGSLEDSVADGAAVLTGEEWRHHLLVDVGLTFNEHACHAPNLWSLEAPMPLFPPYEPVPDTGSAVPVHVLRPECQVVRFQERVELTDLLSWALSRPPGDTVHVAVVTGVGGAGKSRLAAEVADRLKTEHGWLTGIVPLRPNDLDDRAAWLGSTCSPCLVVLDYADAHWMDVVTLVTRLRDRPGGSTCLLLTARGDTGWRADVTSALTRHRINDVPIEIVPLRPQIDREERVYRRAFEGVYRLRHGSHRSAPRMPQLPAGATTLDVVLVAWLDALDEGSRSTTRNDLYDAVVAHERRYWKDTYGPDAPSLGDEMFDRAAACVTLANPEPAGLAALLRLITDHPPWAQGLERTFRGCLTSAGGLSIKPDTIGDHLAMSVFGTDDGERLFRRMLGASDVAGRRTILANLGRAVERSRDVAARLAVLALEHEPELVTTAYELARAGNDACARALVTLVEDGAADLPLARWADEIPLGHTTLRSLALAAAERMLATARHGAARDADDVPRLLNNVAARLADAGRRDDALRTGQEAADYYRRLAEANPAAFLPDLGMSLNNLAGHLANAGRREEALATAEEAVTLRRRLAEANPAAFLPDLAASLNNLANHLADAGRRDDALATAEEAVTHYRRLAEANPAAFLPDLAMSLNNLANHLVDAGRDNEAVGMFQGAIDGLDRPGYRAELTAHRSAWRHQHGDPAGALDDLARVAEVAADGSPVERQSLARARRLARRVAQDLPADDRAGLPGWLVDDAPDDLVGLLNEWIGVAGTTGEADFLKGHANDLLAPDRLGTLRTIAALYPDRDVVSRCVAVVDACMRDGFEETVGRLDDVNRRTAAIREWERTPTWSSSRDYLEEHRAVLQDEGTTAILAARATAGDAVAVQHLAIVLLTRTLPIPDIYDALTEPGDAWVMLAEQISAANVDTVELLLLASPHLRDTSCYGAVGRAAVHLLRGHPDDAVKMATIAAAAGADAARKAGALRLRGLARVRPDLAEAVERVVTTLTP